MSKIIIVMLSLLLVAGCTKRENPTQPTSGVAVTYLGRIISDNLSDPEIHEFVTPSGVHCIQSHVAGSLAIACEFPKQIQKQND